MEIIDSDDDEVQFIECIVNVDKPPSRRPPTLIDLTQDCEPSQANERSEPRPSSQQPEQPQANGRTETTQPNQQPEQSNASQNSVPSPPPSFKSNQNSTPPLFKPSQIPVPPRPTQNSTPPLFRSSQNPATPIFRPSQNSMPPLFRSNHNSVPQPLFRHNEKPKIPTQPNETQLPPLNQVNEEPQPSRVNETQKQPPKTQVDEKQIPPQPSEKPVISDRELMLQQKTRGNEKYKNKEFNEAIKTYRSANELAKKIQDNEMSATLHFNLAMTYDKLGSYDQAVDECANAVKLKDNYFKAHLKRGEIYHKQRKFEEAVICYEHICELDNTNEDYKKLLNQAKGLAKQTKKSDYLEILGLDSNYSKQDLKQAYRQKALKHHPDRHSHADIVTRRIEEKYFKDASEAHTNIQKKFYNYNQLR